MKKTLLIGALLVGLGLTTTLNATYYCGKWISGPAEFLYCTPLGCGEDGETLSRIRVPYIRRCVDKHSSTWEETETREKYGACNCTY